MDKKKKPIVLTTVQMIALQTCVAEVRQARAKLMAVQQEIGLDPNKDYNLNPNTGEVSEFAPKQEI